MKEKNKKLFFYDIETTGLNPVRKGARITCLGIVDEDGNETSFLEKEEFDLLYRFNKWLNDLFSDEDNKDKEIYFIGWNSDRFDKQWINIRAMKHNLKAFFNREEVNHFDLKDWFGKNPKKYGVDRDERWSLNNFARFFGIESKSGDGKRAIYLWSLRKYNSEMLEELREYCLKDCKIVKTIFEKVKSDVSDDL